MKRIAAILLAAALAAGMCACSKQPDSNSAENATAQEATSDMNAVKANFDKAVAFVESNIDTEDMTANDSEDGFSMYRNWDNNEPKLVPLPEDIEINGKTITIGKTTVRELSDLGMEIEKSMEQVDPHMITSVNLMDNNKSFMLDVDNSADKTQAIDDLTISGFNSGIKDFTLPYSYSGVDYDSTIEDVITKLGKSNVDVRLEASDRYANITLNYFYNVNDGKTSTDDNLSVVFSYDPAQNSAQLSSVSFSRIVSEAINESATE